ncbi:hypothetical protein [Aneurinibacillus sp. REN35]|uniref:hypothetical protein n=1 Tax=Aneurinibacillus sp. REN35 TaxID=3237286 RepID=UPI00352874E6
MRNVVILVESFSATMDGEPTVFEVCHGLQIDDRFAIYVDHEYETTSLAEIIPTNSEGVFVQKSYVCLGYNPRPGEDDAAYLRRIVRRMKRMSIYEYFTTRLDRRNDEVYDIASD